MDIALWPWRFLGALAASSLMCRKCDRGQVTLAVALVRIQRAFVLVTGSIDIERIPARGPLDFKAMRAAVPRILAPLLLVAACKERLHRK
eukprot:1162083-Pelagomonas_calceolata.AAC.12